jgi:multiple sugar transport system permease protein
MSRRRSSFTTFRVAALVVVVVVLLAPLVWMLLASFKSNVDIYDTSKAVFFSPTLDNYTKVLAQANYGR